MGQATEVLEREHRYIGKVIALMSSLADDLDRGKPVPAEILRDIVTFLRIFATQCHHTKEEEHLFSLLESRGVPGSGCPLAAMRAEHAAERILLGKVAAAAADYIVSPLRGKDALRDSLRELADLCAHHIWKEDYLVFPMADKILDDADQQQVTAAFADVEAGIGVDVHHAFEGLVRRLGPEAGECPVCHATAA